MALNDAPIQQNLTVSKDNIKPNNIWVQWFSSVVAEVNAGGGGGVSDHGALTGLSDDDHTQYMKKASNLSDVADAATSATNLGLGVADDVTHATMTVDELQLTGGTGTQGTFSWNTDEETADLILNGSTLQLGQEIHIHCKNQTGTDIADGVPVMAVGVVGASGRIKIAPMDGTDATNAKYYLGVTTESIANGDDGKVTCLGKVRGVDTSSWSIGDVLWISSATAGTLTATEPSDTEIGMPIAFVVNSHHVNGTIFSRASSLDEHLYSKTTHTHDTADIVSGTFADARISQSSVTQHQSALSLTASQVSDFDTEVSNNTDVTANTAARHDAVTVSDSPEIDFTLTGQQITASLVAGSIDESKLDTSVNASLDLADSAIQSGDNVSELTNDAGYLTSNAVDSVNTQTGAVVLDADDISDTATTNKFTTAGDISKLAGIEATADVTDETNVTDALDGATLSAVTVATGDKVLVQDVSDSDNLKTVTAQSIADLGGGGGSSSDNYTYAETSSVHSTTTAIPFDNTIPTSSEGAQALSASITPTSSSNKIKVTCSGFAASSTVAKLVVLALFRGTTCIKVAPLFQNANQDGFVFSINELDSPSTTSATTYSLRFGCEDTSTAYINSNWSGSSYWSTAGKTTLLLEEVIV